MELVSSTGLLCQGTDDCAVNVGVLGTLGYLSYLHWDQPVWDRRYLAAITAGLLAFFGGEGCVDLSVIESFGSNLILFHSLLAESYREREYPKRR